MRALVVRGCIIVIIAMVAFFALEGLTQAGIKVIVTKEDNGKEITVTTGDVIQIELEVLGAAGYMWKFEDLDSELLELMKEETKSITKDELIGGPIIKIWQLRARKAGKTEVSMYCFRPWEGKDKAIGTFRVKVKILK